METKFYKMDVAEERLPISTVKRFFLDCLDEALNDAGQVMGTGKLYSDSLDAQLDGDCLAHISGLPRLAINACIAGHLSTFVNFPIEILERLIKKRIHEVCGGILDLSEYAPKSLQLEGYEAFMSNR